ncbi:MAG: rod shape-determining protein MreD [Anaerolineae bacterium]
MLPYLLFFALGLAALLQVSFLPALRIAGVYPNLALVIVVVWALLRNTRSAVGWALIAGLWLDLLSGSVFGVYTLGLVAAAALTGTSGQTVYRPSPLLAVIMLTISTALQYFIQMTLLWLNGTTLVIGDILLRLTLPEIVYNCLVMLALYPLLVRIERATGQERLPLE